MSLRRFICNDVRCKAAVLGSAFNPAPESSVRSSRVCPSKLCSIMQRASVNYSCIGCPRSPSDSLPPCLLPSFFCQLLPSGPVLKLHPDCVLSEHPTPLSMFSTVPLSTARFGTGSPWYMLCKHVTLPWAKMKGALIPDHIQISKGGSGHMCTRCCCASLDRSYIALICGQIQNAVAIQLCLASRVQRKT